MRAARVVVVVSLLAALFAPSLAATSTVAAASSAAASPRVCVAEFSDVPCGHGLHGEIDWLVGAGLAQGYSDGTFRPGAVLSRQATAAMLFRLAGMPGGPFPDPGFSDVGPTHPFLHEIAWMVDAGLTTGYADGTFRPTAATSRQALAGFLYRVEGSPPGPFPDPGFSDVGPTHLFHDAIAWLAATGIAAGYADGTFRPTLTANRGTAASFLARHAIAGGFDPATADRCEFLDPSECLLMWPSDYLTTEDPTTDTGRRLNIQAASVPQNVAGDPVDTGPLNRNDGFSPGTPIMAHIPWLDLTTTGAPPIGDIGQSLEADSPMVLIDADTGERHPFFAELDTGATDEERLLFLRPAVNFEEGHRYVVGLRNLRDWVDAPLEPSLIFRTYSEQIETAIPAIEARRPAMEDIFSVLTAAGVDRHELFLAWDFTVASERNLSERLLHIRDDAFAALGSDAPTYTVTSIEDLTVEQDANIARRVSGTYQVPLYLTGAGEPGTQFNWGVDGLPARNGTFTADFTCRIPRVATPLTPARISLYGHGLLGSRTEVNAGNVRSFANEHDIVFCATDWIGMASGDVANVIGILQNVAKFPTLADRAQQGILNTLFLGRLMKHPDGFAADAAFQSAGQPVIDNDELFFDGNSQGAIMGGAATAVAQDWTRAVLGVAGMNYSFLLQRSSDWPVYESILTGAYPNRVDRQVGIAIIQTLWDRAETNGYAHHLTDDPLPGTPPHQILLHVAYADFQVSMWAAEVEARTIGASVRMPALAPGRHPDAHPYWNLPTVTDSGFTGSVMVVWDSGNPPPPQTNTPPTGGSDPHSKPRAQAIAREQKSAFFYGAFIDVCGNDPCLAP